MAGQPGAGAALARQLQQTYGNRYVQQVVKQAKGSSAPTKPIIQPKLMLGPVGDKYEQEADRKAKEVTSGQVVPLHQPIAQSRNAGQRPGK